MSSNQHNNKLIRKLDKALATYYKSLNVPYSNNHIGIFASFCALNGFSDVHIKYEIDAGAANCKVLDFHVDDNDNNIFPLKPPINDSQKKTAEIYRILKYCCDNGYPPYYKINSSVVDNDDDKKDLHVSVAIANDNSWICKLCTMNNNEYIPYCEMCLVPRDVQNNPSVLIQLKTKLISNDDKLLNAQKIRDIAKLLRDLKKDMQQLRNNDKNIRSKIQKEIQRFCNKVDVDYNPHIVQDFITDYNIDNNHFKEQKKINKNCHPVCRCGTKMISIKENNCYTTYSYVICDICDKKIKSKDTIYHCPKKDQSIIHPQGFDICFKCTKKYVHRLRYFVALIICPTMTNGNYKCNDADELKKMFKKLGFHRVVCLEAAQTTTANIKKALNDILPDKNKKNVNQFTAICYSGHGRIINGVYHFQLSDNETFSSEILNKRYETINTFTGSLCVGANNIKNEFWNRIYRHNTVLLINSCHAGGASDGVNAQRIATAFAKKSLVLAATVGVLGGIGLTGIVAIKALADEVGPDIVRQSFACFGILGNECVAACLTAEMATVIALAAVCGICIVSAFIIYKSLQKSAKCESISIIASCDKTQYSNLCYPVSPFIKHIIDFFNIFLNPDQSSTILNGSTITSQRIRDTPPILFEYLEYCYELKNKNLGGASLQDLKQSVRYHHIGFQKFAMCPIFNQK